MHNKLILRIFYSVICLVSFGCANVVTPTGGDKDITPPEPISFDPENNSVNFTGNSISIRFKDYVQLNDVFNQILISPPIEEMPDFKLRGKSLNIEFKAPLKESTTYTINFGQSIKDITESNVLENFTYVFSTGNELDSLSVSGKITDLFTNTIPKSAYALLYLNASDSSVTKEKPYYFAKADASGAFKINNIKSGTYRLYGLEDQNFNYYYDLPNEKIAFQGVDLVVDTTITNQKLKLFSEDKLPLSIIELKSIAYGETRIIFSKQSDPDQINYIGQDPENGFFIRNKNNDTLLFWHSNYKIDKHVFSVSINNIDTVREVSTKSYPDDSVFFKQKNAFRLNIQKASPAGRFEVNPEQPIILLFNHPIKQLDAAKILLQQDTTLIVSPELGIDSFDSRQLVINYTWKEDTNYDLFIQQQATKDLFGLFSDSMTVKLKTKKVTDYGTLTAIINNKTGKNMIFQFLSADQSTIIREEYLSSEKFKGGTFELRLFNLNPGVYKIKAIIDTDGNQKWTPGNLMQQQLPEAVYFFPVDQTIRANWESEIEWLIE